MTKKNNFERLLRWYPPLWRSHYGTGFEALLEDTYGAGSVPWRDRLSMARGGLIERTREFGIVGTSASSQARLLTGSQLVLCGWTLFIFAGVIFAKFTEHWNNATFSSQRTLTSISFTSVQWAGIVGALLVLGAATVVLPSLFRYVRVKGWRSLRRPFIRIALALLVSSALTTSVVLRAHFLSHYQRNGGSNGYAALVLLAGVAIISTTLTLLTTAISLTRQITFSRRLLRNLSIAAVALTVLMVAITLGSGIWWTNEARFAPAFLANSIGSGIFVTSSTYPPALVIMGVLMLSGLSMALLGVSRVISGLRHGNSNTLTSTS